MRPDVTIVTEDTCSRFHTRAWRTSLWSQLTCREAQRDRPTDVPAQGRLLQEELDECGHEGPQSQPPALPPLATHPWCQSRCTGARWQDPDLPGARLGLGEAVWPRACLHFAWLPVDPTNWLLWLFLPLFHMRITELGHFCGGFPTGRNCKLMEEGVNHLLSACLLGMCPQSGF